MAETEKKADEAKERVEKELDELIGRAARNNAEIRLYPAKTARNLGQDRRGA